MNTDKLSFFRGLIQKEIAELITYQTKTMAEMTIATERLPDLIDHTVMQADRDFELIIRDRERKLITKMEETIQRIDDGTYGICDDCGEEISERRLIARPVTNLCINCKTQQEKAEKMRGEGGDFTLMRDFGESFPYRQEILADL